MLDTEVHDDSWNKTDTREIDGGRNEGKARQGKELRDAQSKREK